MPIDAKLVTEQELRCFADHALPAWVPSLGEHRPDGFSQVPGTSGKITIAFEVELNEKGAADYRHVARYYDLTSNVHRILWLVTTPSIARRIHSRLEEGKPDADKHNFITCDEFFKHGWQSQVTVGPDRGQTVESCLRYRRCTGGVMVPRQYHLNVSKSPHRSKSSRFYEPGDFSN